MAGRLPQVARLARRTTLEATARLAGIAAGRFPFRDGGAAAICGWDLIGSVLTGRCFVIVMLSRRVES